jgi:hypothetical protein
MNLETVYDLQILLVKIYNRIFNIHKVAIIIRIRSPFSGRNYYVDTMRKLWAEITW